MRLLLISGVAEGAELAREIRRGERGWGGGAEIVAALDRRSDETPRERFPAHQTRGMFESAEAMMTALKWDRIAGVVDAAHPFDVKTQEDAARAAGALGLPLLQFRRPLWRDPGAKALASRAEAAAGAPFFARAFLAVGQDGLAAFARRRDLWTLARVPEAPARYPLPRGDFAAGRGPFSLAHEQTLLSDYRISLLIADNVGGAFHAPLLKAAVGLGCARILISPPEGPPPPAAGARASAVGEALDWLRKRFRLTV